MAGFATGLNDSVSMFLGFRKMALDEEELELRRSLQAQQMLESSSRIEGVEAGIRASDAAILASGAAVEASGAATLSSLATTEATNQAILQSSELHPLNLLKAEATAFKEFAQGKYYEGETKQTLFDLETDIQQQNVAHGVVLIDQVMQWANHPDFMARRGTGMEAFFLNKMANISDDLTERSGTNLLLELMPEKHAAHEAIAPFLESDDWSGDVIKDNALEGHIATLFESKMVHFIGREFESDQVSGTIKNVELNGTFQAADAGRAVLVGAKYTIEDAQGNTHTVEALLPDTTTGTISGDVEPSDARAVSVSDIIDFVASSRQIMSVVLRPENVNSMLISRDIEQQTRAALTKTDSILERTIKANAIDIQTLAVDAFSDSWILGKWNRNTEDLADPTKDAEEKDKIIRTALAAFPGLSIGQFGTDSQGYLYLPEGKQLRAMVQNAMIPNAEESMTMAREGISIPFIQTTKVDTSGVNKFTFDNNIQISEGTNRGDYINTLGQIYGVDEVNSAVISLEARFNERYTGAPSDDAMLDMLWRYFRRRR